MRLILDFSLNDLEIYLKKQNFPVFSARQIFSWVYKKREFNFDRMTNLSYHLRNHLKHHFYISNSILLKRQISSDGTQKFLYKLSDEERIESVLIPISGRLTACISTQVGCRFACRFCASGMFGWRRNLSSGEIVEQLLCLEDSLGSRVNNVVFMGVGEPLDNYDNVLKAVRIFNSPDCLHIGARKMTISTCGLIPGIQRLAEENIQIELSISLHAADNRTRTYLMPINKRYPLEKLLSACRAYFRKTKRQITFEYTLIKNVNSDLRQSQRLARLLVGLDAKVNLIIPSPFRREFAAPNKLEILLFKNALLKHGIPTTIRRPRGIDIQAACGQLRITG